MLPLATDENFNNDILRGVLRRNPDVDINRVQDAGLSGADAPTILEWSVREGKPMPGVFEVGRSVPIGVVIEEILLIAEYSLEDEWEGQVRYLPLH